MAIVYRVENWEGFGPYSQIAPSIDVDLERRPEPEEDELHRFRLRWVFGFGGLDALASWFSGQVIGALSRDGEHWLISKYEVEERYIDRGRLQLAFDKDRATHLGCAPLTKIRDLNRSLSAEDLEQSFEAHRPCVPHQHHSAFAENLDWGIYRDEERQTILDTCFDNLTEGCYYRINRSWYSYREGRFHAIGGGTYGSVGSWDPSHLRPTARFVKALRPPGSLSPKRSPEWLTR